MTGSTLPPWRGRPIASKIPLAMLLLGSGISSLGNTMAALAIPWYVLTTTGSAALTGVAASVNGAAVLCAALLGGALIDRLGARRVIIAADVASGVTVALIPLLASAGLLPFWALLLLILAGALLDPPGNAARQTLLPDIAAPAGISGERATAAYTTVLQLTQLAGAPLAGLLILGVGVAGVLWVDVATFAAAAALLLALVPGPVRAATTAVAPDGAGSIPRRYTREVAEGLQFLLRDPLLRALVLKGAVQSLLGPALLGVVLPVYVLRLFGTPVNLGLLLAAYTAGAIASGALYAVIAPALPRRPILVHSVLGMTLGVGLLALTPPLWLMLVALVLLGLEQGPGPAIFNALVQRRTPPPLRGRVISAVIAFALAGGPAGVLLGGLALELAGLRLTLLALLAGYAATWLVLLRNHALCALDTPPLAADETPLTEG